MNARTVLTSLAAGTALTLGGFALAPSQADAFCGFYVSGGEADLFNDATQVALMREGTKTILSMQNNYQGPTKQFAMVVPVPEILQEENVKTLPDDLFSKLDTLTAPRLVEYWERDPCAAGRGDDDANFGPPLAADGGNTNNAVNEDAGSVTVEAEFAVGEYDIVILSATEANALDTWLTDNNYNIPSGAEPLFSSYIQQGMYFFVAKVDPAKVTFKNNQAVLSPLRFDYDSDTFQLPVRLGMVNSAGTQDLITYVLAQDRRYEVANYDNTFIPTNIEVNADVKQDFGTFYTKLFDRTVAQSPQAVVTEYSWDASTCDPCPGPTLDGDDYATLGADVLAPNDEFGRFARGWTVTRLHARYDKSGLSDDLVFRAAEPVVGGRERYNDDVLERGATPASFNNFQGRYIVRNEWQGAVTCSDPVFERWGGPPEGVEGSQNPSVSLSPNTRGEAATADTRGALDERMLETLVEEDIDEIGVESLRPDEGIRRGGRCSAAGIGAGAGIPAMMLGLLGLLGVWRRREQ